MSATGNQVVTQSEGHKFLPGVAFADAPTAPPQQQEQQAAPAQQPTPQQQAPRQPQAAPAQQAQAPAAAVAQEVDPLEAAIEASMSPQKAPDWTPEAKDVFKHYFGHEDPLAYKSDIESKLEAANLLKGEYDKIAPLKDAFGKFTPSLQRAFQMAMDGKADEAQRYLRDLPEDVFLNREAKNIHSDRLIETYLPGKISKEDFEALKDPDTDPDIKVAIESKVKHYREIASDMHERERQKAAQEVADREAMTQAQQQSWMKSTADALASAASDPLLKTMITDEVRQVFQTGNFVQPFLAEGGSALSQEAVKRYLWAVNGPKIAQAQYNVGYRKGKNEGSLQEAQFASGAPPSTGRATGTPPDNSVDAVKQGIFQHLALVSR